MSVRADAAQPGDRTCYNTTVVRREPEAVLGLYAILHTVTADGLELREVWPIWGTLDVFCRDDVSLRSDAVRPTMTIRNPLGEEPWVLDVLAVSEPDADGMVVIVAIQGAIGPVAGDWHVHPYTLQDADFETALLMEEWTRLDGEAA